MENSYWATKGYRNIENILDQVSKLKLTSFKNVTTLNWYYFSVPCVGIYLENSEQAFEFITKQVSVYEHIKTNKKIMIINGASHLWWTMKTILIHYVDQIDYLLNVNRFEYLSKRARSFVPKYKEKRYGAQAIVNALETML